LVAAATEKFLMGNKVSQALDKLSILSETVRHEIT